jgi:hypothetical protein
LPATSKRPTRRCAAARRTRRPNDPKHTRSTASARRTTSSAAAASSGAFSFSSADPNAQFGPGTPATLFVVATANANAGAASPNSFRVAWIERRYADGALASTERWTAILTIAIAVALIGPLANEGTDLDGGWGVTGETPAVTVEQGLRKKLPNAKISYARGGEIRRTISSRFDDFFPGAKKSPPLTAEENSKEIDAAVRLAKSSDVSVLVLGELANMSGEYASRSTLELPGRQEELLEKIVANADWLLFKNYFPDFGELCL